MKSKKNINSYYSQNNKDLNQQEERVLVYVRIRPFNEDEINRDSSSPIEVIDTKNNAMICKFQKI